MLHYFFSWYQGGVWSNILASLLWAIPAYFIGRSRHKKVKAHLQRQDEKLHIMHGHIKQVHNHLGVQDVSE